MATIHKVKVKNDISFGNTEDNNKSGNTNTALGVGLGAGVLGYFGGRKFFAGEPSTDQVLIDPKKYIPANLSEEEQKAADILKSASEDMTNIDKKAEEVVAEEFKAGQTEKVIKNAEKKIQQAEKDIAYYQSKIEKTSEKLGKQNGKLVDRNTWINDAPNGFVRGLRKLFRGPEGIEGKILSIETDLNSHNFYLNSHENKLGLYKAVTDGKVTRESYKTYLSDAIKTKILSKAEEALKVFKGKMTKINSTKNGVITAAAVAIATFLATLMVTKPKEAPIPQEVKEIGEVKELEEAEAPEEVEVVEVTEETQEAEESGEKAA